MMGRGIRGCAQKCDSKELHATPALWDHKPNHCNKLEVKPDYTVCPQKDKADIFVNALPNVGKLKITEQIRLTTVKNVACRTTKPSLNNAWCGTEVIPISNVSAETVEKAATIILNSTPFKLGMILKRKNKAFSWVAFSKDALNRIPMPLLCKMKPSQFRALAKVYDKWCKQPRKRLPETHLCPVQLAIDRAVCQNTGFDENLCFKARHLLAQEPMVTGKRYKAQPEETSPELFD